MSEPATYARFVRLRQDAILREFFDEPGHCFIGIPGLEAFAHRYFGRGSIQPLSGAGIPQAVIWSRGPGTEELWVRPVDKSVAPTGAYRDHWQAFVAQLGGGTVSYTIGGRAQAVDHLLPETFAARHGYAYVRVTMIDQRANAAVGSTIEKSMANRVAAGRSMLADWFTIAKASCFRGSFARHADAGGVMAELRRHLASRGFALPPGEAAAAPETMEAILRWARAG